MYFVRALVLLTLYVYGVMAAKGGCEYTCLIERKKTLNYESTFKSFSYAVLKKK